MGHILTKTIKESLYIRVNNPPLNKNIGKYHLPDIKHPRTQMKINTLKQWQFHLLLMANHQPMYYKTHVNKIVAITSTTFVNTTMLL